MVQMDIMMSWLRRRETSRTLKTKELKSQRSLPTTNLFSSKATHPRKTREDPTNIYEEKHAKLKDCIIVHYITGDAC